MYQQQQKSCLSLGTIELFKVQRDKKTIGKGLRVLQYRDIYTKPFPLPCAPVHFLGIFIPRPTDEICKEIQALLFAFSPSI